MRHAARVREIGRQRGGCDCLRLCVKIQDFISRLWNGSSLCKLLPRPLWHRGVCSGLLHACARVRFKPFTLLWTFYLFRNGICWTFIFVQRRAASHTLHRITHPRAALHNHRLPKITQIIYFNMGSQTCLFCFGVRGPSCTVTFLHDAYLVFTICLRLHHWSPDTHKAKAQHPLVAVCKMHACIQISDR